MPLLSSGLSYSELMEMDITEVYRAWAALARKRHLEKALHWYNETIKKIRYEAREAKDLGNGKTRRPSESEILRKEARLKRRYFKDEADQDWKKLEKEEYYNSIIQQRAFLKKYHADKKKRKIKK